VTFILHKLLLKKLKKISCHKSKAWRAEILAEIVQRIHVAPEMFLAHRVLMNGTG